MVTINIEISDDIVREIKDTIVTFYNRKVDLEKVPQMIQDILQSTLNMYVESECFREDIESTIFEYFESTEDDDGD